MKTSQGCDMRGLLCFQILWLVSKREMCGKELSSEIGKRKGQCPKAGTIYPALRNLVGDRLLSRERSGKTVRYRITRRGRSAVAEAEDYMYRTFGDMFEEIYLARKSSAR